MDRRIINASYEATHFILLQALARMCGNPELMAGWPRVIHAREGVGPRIDTIFQRLGEEPSYGGVNCYFRLDENAEHILVLHEDMNRFGEITDNYDSMCAVPDDAFLSFPFHITMDTEALENHIYHWLWSPEGPTLGMN